MHLLGGPGVVERESLFFVRRRLVLLQRRPRRLPCEDPRLEPGKDLVLLARLILGVLRLGRAPAAAACVTQPRATAFAVRARGKGEEGAEEGQGPHHTYRAAVLGGGAVDPDTDEPGMSVGLCRLYSQ